LPGIRELEAAGIEPASRGTSAMVSTCVVRCFVSRPAVARRQAPSGPASWVSRPAVTSPTRLGPACCLSPRPPAGVTTGTCRHLGGHAQRLVGM